MKRDNRGGGKEPVMKKLISSCAVALGLVTGLSACTDPYDPGQRAIGGAVGAVGGAATTPSPGYYGYGYNEPGYYGRSYYGPVILTDAGPFEKSEEP
jgi:hypothetical protein